MKKNELVQMKIANPYAAGIDIGSREHFVAVGQEPGDVRKFGVYTTDHESIISWLKERGITTVAMEATGSYWQTLFSAIQSSGIEVILTNSKHIKNPEGKTDIKDSRWLQRLHTLGLLKGCFLPSEEVLKLRQYHRHRTNLLEDSSRCILRMQKALQLMNIRLEVALSDISGVSGMKIIEAIVKGERNGDVLANLVSPIVRKTKEEIAIALRGNWKEELIYELQDEYEIYNSLIERIKNCDKKIEAQLIFMSSKANNEMPDPPIELRKKKRQAKQVNVDVSKLSYQYYGVDLMSIDGVAYNTIMTLLSEVGKDIFKFSSAKKFAKWLRLAPNNKMSGSKIISSRTPVGKNALANALRNAANTIAQRKEGSMKKFFSRIAFKKGRAAAITATARKIAVIMWHMIVKKKAYNPQKEIEYESRIRKNVINNLKKKIKQLNILPEELVLSQTYNSFSISAIRNS